MPPKVRYKKEEIIRAAVEVVRRGGFNTLNARAIALELGCSTQPLYRELRNMDEIKKAVENEAGRRYVAYVTQSDGLAETPYKSAGIAFLRFANEEKELFKLLFIRSRSSERRDADVNDPGMAYAMEAMMRANHFTLDEAKAFHRYMSIYTHGLGVMLATGYIDYDEKELSEALTVEARALSLLFKQKPPDITLSDWLSAFRQGLQ